MLTQSASTVTNRQTRLTSHENSIWRLNACNLFAVLLFVLFKLNLVNNLHEQK